MDRRSQGKTGRIFNLTGANQGIGTSGISAKLGLDNIVIRYHCDFLQRTGFINVVRSSGRAYYFTTDYSGDMICTNPTERQVLDLIERFPGKTEKELIALRGNDGSPYYHLRRLLKRRRIERDGRPYRYYPKLVSENEFTLFLDDE